MENGRVVDKGDRPMYGTLGKYTIMGGLESQFNVCFVQNRTLGLTEWQATKPLMNFLPGFMLQLTLIMTVSRVLMTILKPMRQPRFVSEILAGVLLGPVLTHSVEWLALYIHPFEEALLLETMASLGITFYMFLAGLEMDLRPIRKMEKTAYSVAIVGIILPGCGGMILYQLVRNARKDAPMEGGFIWAIALSVTSLPDLARILSKLKLLSTDLGKTAMTSAVLTDLVTWILLAATVAIVNGQGNFLRITPTLIFLLLCWFVIRPLLFRTIKRIGAAREESSSSWSMEDKHVGFILTGVLFCGFTTELCGVHPMFGAFMFGLMIPRGEIGTKIIDKIEEFVVGILLPPVFLVAGLRTNIVYISAGYHHGLVATIIIVSSLIKIVSTLLVCTYLTCSFRDSLALGVLMNTKGVIAIIVLHEGRNLKGLDQQTFTWMLVSIVIMTFLVGPVVSFTHKSTRHLKQQHRMNLERSKPDSELRVLACLHSSKNLSGLINLLHLSNATRKSPIVVFAVYLVELTGRASAMLIFHDKSETNDISSNPTRERAESEQIVRAFESLQKDNQDVTAHPLTAVSPYATMHEDVSNFAIDKNVAVILLPYHKKPNGIGGWEDQNLEHKKVSQHLLANAPCSIGILVDRGLTRHLPVESQHDRIQRIRIAMLFVEGSDDREALAYAWRMAGNPRVTLTVVRFVPGKDLLESAADEDDTDPEVFSAMFEKEKEKLLDDDYINEFRFRTMHNQSITYMEKPVNGGDQIVSTITSAHNDYDLYIVGRGYDRQSPLTSGLSDWSEYPEIGLIGDTLISVDSLMSASVLVMQQSTPVATLINPCVSQKGITSADTKALSSDQPFVTHTTSNA
ncbi:cation/H+ exchanger 23 [Hibiscus trionum]|uniref:Cation/H+ exchanger 23 n=1 Tax=Hibiscus trionum TaxID=183268 RepID=A0A9W7MY31_HIBTR|nr:cation/H+ exchanger 23 [Hibiscus trionum]